MAADSGEDIKKRGWGAEAVEGVAERRKEANASSSILLTSWPVAVVVIGDICSSSTSAGRFPKAMAA